ncbi:hypothetical protein GR702_04560 [Novosphingobium sp. FGD1]|uniref:Uncharacterized protein n=1 Tax=Novosphingobium silvae TaxID=2692619 RepID=A0A7X4K6C8_9SPHN|nr:hypothetical protein [Novosphingobium silvae]MYL97044.1 hypothetical protein [Novosphingobium silvae]
MSDNPHQCFTVETTAYLRNLSAEDRREECYAIYYQDAPENLGDGTTRIHMSAPVLIVSFWMGEQKAIAECVSGILNAHWDENASLAASAAALRDAGLLAPADYHRTINRIEARERLCRLKEIVA